jgi:hypothetical protein
MLNHQVQNLEHFKLTEGKNTVQRNKVKVRVKFNLGQDLKEQRWSRGIALHFL